MRKLALILCLIGLLSVSCEKEVLEEPQTVDNWEENPEIDEVINDELGEIPKYFILLRDSNNVGIIDADVKLTYLGSDYRLEPECKYKYLYIYYLSENVHYNVNITSNDGLQHMEYSFIFEKTIIDYKVLK